MQFQQAHQGGWRLEEGTNFTPPPRPREPSGGAALFQHRLRHGSSCMEPAELDLILRIQWKSLHMRSPYLEDFYYLVGPFVILWASHCQTVTN